MEIERPPERCKREKAGDTPAHRIIVLPDEVTSTGFKHATLPVVLCAHCDGGAHVSAIRTHDKRKPL